VTDEYEMGDKGDDVRTIQKWLISQGYNKVEASGYFGDLTRRAIKHFQEENASTVLAPAGLSVGTGAWGMRTATRASALGLCDFDE
jgi:peptidoglycan hydrolase-like protein with peptidoglycan-binding domain